MVDAPPAFRADRPPPNPERVSLLLALDWPPREDLEANPRALFDATVQGRPMTDHQRDLLRGVTPNDLISSWQLTHEDLEAQQERLDAVSGVLALLNRYGSSDGETLDAARARMTPEDAAELDRLADIAWPDGYVWLRDTV